MNVIGIKSKILHAAIASMAISAAVTEVGRADVRGWFEENWFGKAPRTVLVLSADDAKWLGPEAEQAAAKEAGVLHWTRPGNHAMTADDWQEIFKAAKDTYVFAYFGNEREGMKLAASEDGLQWRELNDGKPVLVPEVGKEKLLRDPSVVQGPVRRSLPFRVRKQALQIVGSLFGGENRPCILQEGFSSLETSLQFVWSFPKHILPQNILCKAILAPFSSCFPRDTVVKTQNDSYRARGGWISTCAICWATVRMPL